MKKNIISRLTSLIISTALVIASASFDISYEASASDYHFQYKNSLSPDSQIIYDGLAFLVDPREDTVHINLPEAIKINPDDNTSEDITDEQFIEIQIANVISPGFEFLLLDRPDIFWVENPPTFTYDKVTGFDDATGKEIYMIKDIYLSFTIGESFNNDINFARSCKEELNRALYSFPVEGETRYEKLKSIHDQLIMTTTYESTEGYIDYNAYGALVNHRAACQGYSQAFKLLCNREGIPCISVLIDSEHMWNYVQMDDGEWYAIDVTWDDFDFIEHVTGTGISYEYFLKGIQSMFRKHHIAPTKNYGITNQLPILFMKDYECNPVAPDVTTTTSETTTTTTTTTTATEPAVIRNPERVPDIDGDGRISASEAVICTKIILSCDSECECDINNDGYTNSFDLITLKKIMKRAVNF